MKPIFAIRTLLIFALILVLWHLSFGQQIKDWPENERFYKQDTFNIESYSFLLPQPKPKWQYYQAISFSYVDIPRQWTLDNINAPMLTYGGKLSLPGGFNFQGSLATIYVSNRLNVGPFWNYSIHNYHFGIGYQLAYDFGHLNSFGYKTTFSGWEGQPSITAGYSFKRFAIILRGDLYHTYNIDLVEDGHRISLWNSFTNGYSISGFVEQRLYKKKIMHIGIKVNNIRYHFLAWPAFPVNPTKYFVPEFQIGINL